MIPVMGVVVPDDWAIPIVGVLLSAILALLGAAWRSNATLRLQVELLKLQVDQLRSSNGQLSAQLDQLTREVGGLHDEVIKLTSMARLPPRS